MGGGWGGGGGKRGGRGRGRVKGGKGKGAGTGGEGEGAFVRDAQPGGERDGTLEERKNWKETIASHLLRLLGDLAHLAPDEALDGREGVLGVDDGLALGDLCFVSSCVVCSERKKGEPGVFFFPPSGRPPSGKVEPLSSREGGSAPFCPSSLSAREGTLRALSARKAPRYRARGSR